MTFTFKLDLDILLLDLHVKIQVCMSVRSADRVRRTDGRTDTRTDRHADHAKTITPITSEKWGVKIVFLVILYSLLKQNKSLGVTKKIAVTKMLG